MKCQHQNNCWRRLLIFLYLTVLTLSLLTPEEDSPDLRPTGPDVPEDCNGNGVPDSIDIQRGTSSDLNNNGVPDECE